MWTSIVGQFLTGLIALSSLWKDWEDFGALSKKFGRKLPGILAIATIFIVGLTVYQTFHDAREADKRDAENRGKTEQFQQTLGTLLNRINDLQAKVSTEPLLRQNQELIKQVAETKKDVEAAKLQLEKPQELADLESTLGQVDEELHGLEIKTNSAKTNIDGTLEFTILVANKSNFQAKNGSIFLRLCEGCAFAAEPERFTKPPGAQTYDREMLFQAINGRTGISIPLKISAPIGAHMIEIKATVRCENCKTNPPERLHVTY